jgi:hypothetical protein
MWRESCRLVQSPKVLESENVTEYLWTPTRAREREGRDSWPGMGMLRKLIVYPKRK